MALPKMEAPSAGVEQREVWVVDPPGALWGVPALVTDTCDIVDRDTCADREEERGCEKCGCEL